MIIYEVEKQAGLSDLLMDSSKSCISFASVAQPIEIDKEIKLIKNSLNFSLAKISDKDLYPLKTILVTTSWNKNDDVFTKEEVWAARHSPEDKPFNLGHNELDIIGHITANRCIDDKYEIIPDDISFDLIPDKFHILTAAVIYRAIADEERKDQIEKIIAEIPQGKWFVSMECYFQGFDYAVRTPDGSQNRVIARSKESAFLTQHLRAYGGKGEYDGYKVGRLMRNICFSGKGLVEKPANPESIILTDQNSNAISFGSELLNINQLTFSSDKGEKTMAEANANEKLAEALEKAKASAESYEAKAKELAEKVKELEAINKTLASEKEDTGKKYEEVLNQLNETKAAIKLTERVSLLVDAGLDKAEAESKAKKFDSANDEMFSEVVALAKKAMKKDNDNDADEENDDDEDDSKAEKLPGDEKKLKKGKKKAPFQDKTAGKSDDDDDMNADEEDQKATKKAKKSREDATKMKKGKAANMGLKQSKEYDSGEENANDSNESDVGKTDDVSKVRKALSEADADEDEYEDSEAEDETDLDLNSEAEVDEETEKVCAQVADYFDGMFGKKNKKDEE